MNKFKISSVLAAMATMIFAFVLIVNVMLFITDKDINGNSLMDKERDGLIGEIVWNVIKVGGFGFWSYSAYKKGKENEMVLVNSENDKDNDE